MTNTKQEIKKAEEPVIDETYCLQIFKEALEKKVSALEDYAYRIRASLLNIECDSIDEEKSAVGEPFYDFLQRIFSDLKNNVASHLDVVMHFIFNDGECDRPAPKDTPEGTSDLNYVSYNILEIINDIYHDLNDISCKFGCGCLGEETVYSEDYTGTMQEIIDLINSCLGIADTIYNFVKIED